MHAALAYCTASDEERDYRPALANMYHDLEGHCVYCNHCLPCPEHIDVATAIMLVDWATWGVSDELKEWHASLKAKPSDCIECGQCIERCPFGVHVIAKMHHGVALFEWDLWDHYTVDALRAMAGELRIKGHSRMRKGHLIEAIRRVDPGSLYHDLGPA